MSSTLRRLADRYLRIDQRERLARTFLRATTALLAANKTLYAVYDLGREPVTFDFLIYLGAVDLERRRRGLDHVHMVFVPGPKDGFRDEWPDYEKIVDRDARRWRIANLLVPCLRLLPSCTGHIICESRALAHVVTSLGEHLYPAGYTADSPDAQGHIINAYNEVMAAGRQGTDVKVLRPTEQASRYADRWLSRRAAGRKVISITLREYGYNQARNSNLSAWAEFARSLDHTEFFPVILRDLDMVFGVESGVLDGLTMFELGSVNLELRMALYERSYLNLGSSNGPLALCMLSDGIPYIMFKMLTPDVPQANVEFMTKLGIEIGATHMPFASDFQRMVWEDDTLETISREFTAMIAKLDRCDDGEGHRDAAAIDTRNSASGR